MFAKVTNIIFQYICFSTYDERYDISDLQIITYLHHRERYKRGARILDSQR